MYSKCEKLKFSVSLMGTDGDPATFPSRILGLEDLENAREVFGKEISQENLPLNFPRVDWGYDAKPRVELTEEVVRESGHFGEKNKVQIQCEENVLNSFFSEDLKFEDGKISRQFKFDETRFLDQWKKIGYSLIWSEPNHNDIARYDEKKKEQVAKKRLLKKFHETKLNVQDFKNAKKALSQYWEKLFPASVKKIMGDGNFSSFRNEHRDSFILYVVEKKEEREYKIALSHADGLVEEISCLNDLVGSSWSLAWCEHKSDREVLFFSEKHLPKYGEKCTAKELVSLFNEFGGENFSLLCKIIRVLKATLKLTQKG